MGYLLYRKWLRAVKDEELNGEIEKLRMKRRAMSKLPRAYEAWSYMLLVAEEEQKRRDDDHGHLLRGL